MLLQLFSISLSGGHGRDLDRLTQGYLDRLRSPWQAVNRIFRSEALLLNAVATERNSGSVGVWMLDQGGKDYSSPQIADRLDSLRGNGTRRLIAAVGPPNGWSAAARASLTGRDSLLSLGPMTLPHELARLVLAEQLYRAVTILNGHPYHLGHE